MCVNRYKASKLNTIYITGASGFIGTALIRRLEDRKELRIIGLSRSQRKTPAPNVRWHKGDPLDLAFLSKELVGVDTLVHLVGISSPGPFADGEFIDVDLKSAQVAAEAAKKAGVKHIIFVSVAQERSYIMDAYQSARALAENYFKETNIPLSIIRPWYVLGPGRWWPSLLLPIYGLLELIPFTRKKATAFTPVLLEPFIDTIHFAIDNPAESKVVYYEVEDIQQIDFYRVTISPLL